MSLAIPKTTLFDFFHERVTQASAIHGAAVSSDVRVYLANLLTDGVPGPTAHDGNLTLAELHFSAANAPELERAQRYRSLGDLALYRLGLFKEYIQRSTVGESYYADMGASAYQNADRSFKRWFSDAFGDVFEDLATHFALCAAVLGHVRVSPNATAGLWSPTPVEDSPSELILSGKATLTKVSDYD